jgi:hypothetical protein
MNQMGACLFKIRGGVGLVGVDEQQVEWPGSFGHELRQRIQCPPEPQFDAIRQAGLGDGVLRVDLQRDEPAAGSACASQIVL